MGYDFGSGGLFLDEEKLIILQRVEAFAKKSHGSQVRKYTDLPYITHPISVSQRVGVYVGGNLVMEAAALLHDVLEDTKVTSENLLSGLYLIERLTLEEATHIHGIVVELTDVYTKEKFPDKNRAERKALEAERLGRVSLEAKIIKLFDLLDNAESISQFDPNFYKVFKKEAKRIVKNLNIYTPYIVKLNSHMREFIGE